MRSGRLQVHFDAMTADLEFTGERFIPGIPGEIAHEHWHRYGFARSVVAGRRVLDVACGEGYGSALLAGTAAAVAGVDIDAMTLAHARATYANRTNLKFVEGSVTELPFGDSSIDVVVSFETIEHLPASDQPHMLAEFRRVLAPGGFVILSSPNRPEYSESRGYVNPFHLHELDRSELTNLLQSDFPAQRWFRQRRYIGSALWSEQPGGRYEALQGSAESVRYAEPPSAMYFIVVAAAGATDLPTELPALSLFSDSDDFEWKRIDHEAREVMRLDRVLRERDEELARFATHARELEAMVAYRDQAIADLKAKPMDYAEVRESLQSVLNANQERHAREVAAQQHIIAYRGTLRWWLILPLLRARRLWNRRTPV